MTNTYVELTKVRNTILATVIGDVHHANGKGRIFADCTEQFKKLFGVNYPRVELPIDLSFKGSVGAGARFEEFEKSVNPEVCFKGAFTGALVAGEEGRMALNVVDWKERYSDTLVPNTPI